MGREGSAICFQALCDSDEAEMLQVEERQKHYAEPVNLWLREQRVCRKSWCIALALHSSALL